MINAHKFLNFGDYMPNNLADVVVKSNVKHDHIFKSNSYQNFRNSIDKVSELEVSKINKNFKKI